MRRRVRSDELYGAGFHYFGLAADAVDRRDLARKIVSGWFDLIIAGNAWRLRCPLHPSMVVLDGQDYTDLNDRHAGRVALDAPHDGERACYIPGSRARRRARVERAMTIGRCGWSAVLVAFALAAPCIARQTGSLQPPPLVLAGRVDLTWIDPLASEYVYVVERADNGGPFQRLVTLAHDSQSYTDLAVQSSQTYGYRVYASMPGGVRSADSNEVSVTTPANHQPVMSCSLPSDFTVLVGGGLAPHRIEFTTTATDADGDTITLRLLDPPASFVVDPIVVTAAGTATIRVVDALAHGRDDPPDLRRGRHGRAAAARALRPVDRRA